MTAAATPSYPWSTADLAEELSISVKTVRKRAADLGVGIYVGGNHGYRFSEADREALVASMRSPAPKQKTRARRARRRATVKN